MAVGFLFGRNSNLYSDKDMQGIKIRFLLFFLVFNMVGCSYPLQSGGAVKVQPQTVELQAPANSAGQSEVHIVLAKNQDDTLRRAKGEAVTIQAQKANEKYFYLFGGGFCALGLGLIIAKKWLPVGVKMPLASIGLGVGIMLLPLAMEDVLFRYVLMGVGLFVVYSVARKYDVT